MLSHVTALSHVSWTSTFFSFLLLQPSPTLPTTPRPWHDEDEGVEGRRRDSWGGQEGRGAGHTRCARQIYLFKKKADYSDRYNVVPTTRRGGACPLLVMLLPFQHDGEGTCPPLCSPFIFDTTRRASPSSCCCSFRRDGEGTALPVVFSDFYN